MCILNTWKDMLSKIDRVSDWKRGVEYGVRTGMWPMGNFCSQLYVFL